MHGEHVRHTTNSSGPWSRPTRMRWRAEWLRGEYLRAGENRAPCTMPSRRLAVTLGLKVPRAAGGTRSSSHGQRRRADRQRQNHRYAPVDTDTHRHTPVDTDTNKYTPADTRIHSILQSYDQACRCRRDRCGALPLVEGTAATRWRLALAASSAPEHRSAATTQRRHFAVNLRSTCVLRLVRARARALTSACRLCGSVHVGEGARQRAQ